MRRLKRWLRTVDGERIESLSVLLEFQDSILQDKIKIGCMIFPVMPYVPPPLWCYKCQRHGHIAFYRLAKESKGVLNA